MKRKAFIVIGSFCFIGIVALGIFLWGGYDRHTEVVSLYEEMDDHYQPVKQTVLHCAFGYFKENNYDCSYTAIEKLINEGEEAINRFDATFSDTEQFQVLLLRGIGYAQEVMQNSLLLDPGSDDFVHHFNAGYEVKERMLENEDEIYELLEKYFTFKSDEDEEAL
ncbi:hypothetical protein RYX45_14255 [Alkalihalophilus pseudofirmus]|uniref:Uncharacterized protein n=1 Tax=Alkalihalophilus pseudofirmus TaxID=79885 RepID=A0AAJ2U195_ALKPS|nr:hypothetical protein [Alkalihalophilus pseudofirmus]MDV2886349.1 hypothetical protein [Alkalihalophilus pseudofirmus]